MTFPTTRQGLAALRTRLASDAGQVLAEAPYSIVVTCFLFMLLIQPAIWYYTQMVLNNAAASAARVVATYRNMSRLPEVKGVTGGKIALDSWILERKLLALPKGSFFMGKDVPQIETFGDARSEMVTVTITVEQQPLPLIGVMVGTAAGLINARGNVVIKGTAAVPGTFSQVAKTRKTKAGEEETITPDSFAGVYGQKE